VINLHRCPRYKSSNAKLHNTKSVKLALLNTEHTSKTYATQLQTSKFQLKGKFTQLKLLNSNEGLLIHTRTANTMKMRSKLSTER